MKYKFLLCVIFVLLPVFTGNKSVWSQPHPLKPVVVESLMPDFSLPVFKDGNFTLSEHKGKNVMLIFPRGMVGDHWCQICHYQYADLADIEKNHQICKKYNLEVFFVLPYDIAKITDWVEKFPDQMAVIESWKNPPDINKLKENQKKWMETSRKLFPKKFDFKKGEVPLPFPVLIDSSRAVSKGLGLFTTEWNNSKVDQNIPTIFIIDKEGIVRFKYFSQNTVDRPSYEYLFEFIENIILK